jgi:uncharacterized membrane protein YhaH (DUF805 family)
MVMMIPSAADGAADSTKIATTLMYGLVIHFGWPLICLRRLYDTDNNLKTIMRVVVMLVNTINKIEIALNLLVRGIIGLISNGIVAIENTDIY